MKEKIIFFTKAPRPGFGKSRLKNFLSQKERYDLCVQLIEENLSIIKKSGYPYEIYYDGKKEDLDFANGSKKEQRGSGLGEKMYSSIKEELENADKVLLMGSDLQGISGKLFQDAFTKLDKKDLIIAPAKDGGYGLIGMKKNWDVFSDIVYSREDVLEKTLQKAESLGLEWSLLETLRDIDTLEDLVSVETNTDEIKLLGLGEYNINFLCDNSYVLRINVGSQLHLGEKQIPYEYNALREIQSSGVVPEVYEYKNRGKYLPLPFLTMEYIEGRPLDYDKDLKTAAFLLSQIHRLEPKDSSLIWEEEPFQGMFDECSAMFGTYRSWQDREDYVVDFVDRFFNTAKSLGLSEKINMPSIINTELNNRNFIIGDRNVVIDWEKPIVGEKEQDLAHFLVPTTTNWKTDKILKAHERDEFLKEYEKYNALDHQKLGKYLVFNCLRGITWCSMAKVEYSSQTKGIINEDTLLKIDHFLSPEFLSFIERNYYEEYYGNIKTK